MSTTLTASDSKALEELEKELEIKLDRVTTLRSNGYIVSNNTITGLQLNRMQLEFMPGAVKKFNSLTHLTIRDNIIQQIDFPDQYKSLVYLDVSSNNLTDISFATHLTSLQYLDFTTNSVNDLKPVGSLLDLRHLDFTSNLVSDLTPISNLQRLKKIVAYNNRITNISGLETLINLETINFGDNQITEIDSFTSLRNLKFLYLSFNKVRDIYPLSNLTQLETLDLKYNSVKDIRPIENMTSLDTLNLHYNYVEDILSIEKTVNLVTLDLGYNPLRSIVSLEKLKKLDVLNLSKSLPTDLKVFRRLGHIRSLNLSYNSLQKIDFLSSLTNLQELVLQANNLDNIDPLVNLVNLTELQIQNNKFTKFPRWLLESKMEIKTDRDYRKGYNIQNNPIEDVPNAFLKQNNGAISDYLKSLENGSKPVNEIKVIILGEGAAGKTSLVNFLDGKEFNKQESQTHGINIAQCAADLGVTMKIWDFGGQDIMHHTHQLFLTQNSLYILVLNAREKSDTEKWLKLIKVFGGDSPIIILTNKIDENPSQHENIKFLNTKYPNIGERYARISCETGQGLQDFKSILSKTIQELLHVRTLWGNSWLNVKEELEKMREGTQLKDYIHYDVYNELCEGSGVNINHRDTLINWLHQLGVVTYFPDTSLSETNVINPSWLTEAFYSIINAKVVAEKFGQFSIDDLESIIDPMKYPKQKYSFLMGLMTKFELCYQIDNHTYLIPDLLQKEEPEFHFPLVDTLKFKFKYAALLPKALLPKFMVRRHQELSGNVKWRTGMVINDKIFGASALIRIDEEEKEISIVVKGDQKRGYLASILSTFDSINQLYDGLEYEELVPCCCRICKNSDKPYYFKYSILKKLKQKSRGTILCEIAVQDVLVNELLGILIKPEELEQEITNLIGTGSYLTKNYLENGKIENFIKTIKLLFSSVSYLLFDKSEKAYHTPLFLILRTIFGNKAKADEIQAIGRSDIIINLDNHIYVLELKLDGSSKEAIDQIHLKRYYDPYVLENKPIHLIGINFCSDSRNIESYQYEQLQAE